MSAEKATLYKKMAAVMGDLSRVAERGKHEKQRWRYATASDVKNIVRVAMAEHGLALLFQMDEYTELETTVEPGKAVPTHIRAKLSFTIACGETGETVTCPIWVEAIDYSDKAFNKIYTVGEKYFLKTVFLVSSGDEIDPSGESPKRASKRESKKETKWPPRPFDPPTLKKYIAERLPQLGNDNGPPDENRRRYAMASLKTIAGGDNEQHVIVRQLFGRASRGNLTARECEALIAWVGATPGNEWIPTADAVAEAAALLKEAKDDGQGSLLPEDGSE